MEIFFYYCCETWCFNNSVYEESLDFWDSLIKGAADFVLDSSAWKLHLLCSKCKIACVKTNVKNYFQLSKALNLIRILLLSISPAVGEIPENARQAGHCGGDGERKSSAERVCVWWHKGKRLFKGDAPYSDLSHVHFIKCDVFCCLVNPEKRGLLSAASANEKQTLRKAWTRHDHSVCWHLEHG